MGDSSDVAFAFQQTAVIPPIPTVQRELHVSQTWNAWFRSGYFIPSSIATRLLGKLGDRDGKRRTLSVSLGTFLVGSVGAALAPGIGVLIGFRGGCPAGSTHRELVVIGSQTPSAGQPSRPGLWR